MSTTRLKLYNKALTMCGARTISALTDNIESRRVMDTIWDNGAVRHCLEQGYFNFSIRTVLIDATSEIEPDFGYQHAFQKPSDWVRTYAVCSDEYFRSPLTQYEDEVGYWFSDTDPMYVQYVSDGEEYGLSLGDWPEYFTRYVEAYMAAEAAPRLTMSESKAERLKQKELRFLRDARTQDASNQPAKMPPLGSWARSRLQSNLSGNNGYWRTR